MSYQASSGGAVSVLILAGGYSRRMGEDKALLAFGETTALEKMLVIARAVSDDVWVARRAEQPALNGCQVVHDLRPGQGPLAGLEAGLGVIRHDWCLVLPVDALGITEAFVTALISEIPYAKGDQALAIVTAEGVRIHPLHAVYHKSARSVIAKLLSCDRRKVHDLVAAIAVRKCPETRWKLADIDGLSIAPCNTQADVQALRAKLLLD